MKIQYPNSLPIGTHPPQTADKSQGPQPAGEDVGNVRAGGNGTAGTAMAVPVFEGKKCRRLDSILRVRYRMASPSGSS